MTLEKFREKLENNRYFTTRGCMEDGSLKIEKWKINFIHNIAGSCTDECESEDFYKNPRAMFVALDLIYELLEEEADTP
jgi:hypothetical protein